jgi:hypothetical protein
MSYVGGERKKKTGKHKAGAQVKKKKACTTSTLGNGGGELAKKKAKDLGAYWSRSY